MQWKKPGGVLQNSHVVFPSGDVEGICILCIVSLPLHFCTEFSAPSPSRSGLLFKGTLRRIPKPRAKKPTCRLAGLGAPSLRSQMSLFDLVAAPI